MMAPKNYLIKKALLVGLITILITPIACQAKVAVEQSVANVSILAPSFIAPMDRVEERVTKKYFGSFITRDHSPVQPEKFHGYHTGVDFETFAEEQNTPVEVRAICGGQLLRKNWTPGYGGLVVQSCTLEKKSYTIIYGHLKIASVSAKIGKFVAVGKKIGVLGQGYTPETDNERKHLHLGIHKSRKIDVRGYVPNKKQLEVWLNFLQ